MAASISGDALECIVRLPLPTAEAAQIIVSVLLVDPGVAGTQKYVQLWQGDTTRRTVLIIVRGNVMRSVRAVVGSILDQAKLSVRTMRSFPSLSA